MKTSSQIEFTYFIEDLAGEGSHTEFFLDWLEEALGNSNSCVLFETIRSELEQGFKNSSLGELDCTGYGAYGDIHFTFLLTQEQEDNLPAFRKSLDIWTEHFVTKYRLRWLLKFYKLHRESRERFKLGGERQRSDNVVAYLARRKMRNIPAWVPLLK